MKNFSKKTRNYLLAFALLFSIASCNYYMASPLNTNTISAKTIDSLNRYDKFFILRDGNKAYHMKDVSLNDDNKTLNTTLEAVPAYHQMYLNKGRNGKMIYKKNNMNDLKVFNEIHVYTSSDSNITTGNYVLKQNDIKKIELIKKDKAKTTRSHVLVAIAAVIVVAVPVAIWASTWSFGIGGF